MLLSGLLLASLGILAKGGIALCAILSSPPQASHSSGLVTFEGTVALVSEDHLILQSGDDRKTFLVPDDAMILVNRAEATLDDVMPGQFAFVTGTVAGGGQLVATFVNANRQY